MASISFFPTRNEVVAWAGLGLGLGLSLPAWCGSKESAVKEGGCLTASQSVERTGPRPADTKPDGAVLSLAFKLSMLGLGIAEFAIRELQRFPRPNRQGVKARS